MRAWAGRGTTPGVLESTRHFAIRTKPHHGRFRDGGRRDENPPEPLALYGFSFTHSICRHRSRARCIGGDTSTRGIGRRRWRREGRQLLRRTRRYTWIDFRPSEGERKTAQVGTQESGKINTLPHAKAGYIITRYFPRVLSCTVVRRIELQSR